MKIKLKRIVEAKPSLESLVRKDTDFDLAYRLARLAKMINDELFIFEKTRRKIVDKYGEGPDEKGNINIKQENKEKFLQEMDKVLDVEIDLNFIPFTKSEFTNIEITAADLIPLLDVFIIEDQSETED